jgi:hypothetical protein
VWTDTEEGFFSQQNALTNHTVAMIPSIVHYMLRAVEA